MLGERFSSVGVRFTASKVRLAGKYDRIPFPVTIDNGVVSYDGASVAGDEPRRECGEIVVLRQ